MSDFLSHSFGSMYIVRGKKREEETHPWGTLTIKNKRNYHTQRELEKEKEKERKMNRTRLYPPANEISCFRFFWLTLLSTFYANQWDFLFQILHSVGPGWCGGVNWRPVPARTLHCLRPDQWGLRQDTQGTAGCPCCWSGGAEAGGSRRDKVFKGQRVHMQDLQLDIFLFRLSCGTYWQEQCLKRVSYRADSGQRWPATPLRTPWSSR